LLAELLGVGSAIVRPLEFHLAGGGSPDQSDRVLVGELEVDEKRRVENVQHKLLRSHGCLQRQGEMQRQRGTLVFKEVVDRLLKFLLLAVGLGEGEEAEFPERYDIGLRQRPEF